MLLAKVIFEAVHLEIAFSNFRRLKEQTMLVYECNKDLL